VEKTFREGPQDWIHEIDAGVFHSTTVPMRDDKGSLTGVVGSTDDVTPMIRLQRELESAVEAAEVASRSKSVFLTNMSHEIRTPMNAILGITEIQLQNEKLAPEIRELFGRIYSSGDLLLGIINDILDMSKIEAGKLELMPATYEIASLIHDTVQLNVMRIGSKDIEFALHVDENTPATVVGDILRVKQILNNVLSNAFKYTARGRVTLSVSAEAGSVDAESGLTLVFLVSDTGQGMTADQVGRLFEAYARFNLEANRAIEGAGLGMSITQNLVHLMNGTIFVESELARGTTFTVRLPQGDAGAEPLGREVAENLRQFRIHSTAHMKRVQILREPMPYGKVLIVDDMETNIFVARGLLTPYGLTIDSAGSGRATIAKIEQGRVYDIIFMDHMMPEMDGMETTRVLRDMGYAHPVVALTANAVVGQAEIFLANGFDDFLSKPIDLREMNAVLNKFVRDRHPPEVVAAARRDAQESVVDETPQASVDPKLAKIFIRDASKAIAALEALGAKQDALHDEDFRKYVINVHGLKGPLAGIGETELSALAAGLELAGRAQDAAVMAARTPAFLAALRAVIDRISPREDSDSAGTTDEDRAYLREQLHALQAACAAYDKKAARAALAGIEQKAWPQPIRERLDAVAKLLLHSRFKQVADIVDEMMSTP
jgi:signal transduction histidine kinase/CheY-like chemotaxis protein